MGKTLNSENVISEYRKIEAEAKDLHAAAEALKRDVIASGVNPLTDEAAFVKLDDAYKASDLKSLEAADLRGRWQRLQEMDGSAFRAGAGIGPFGGGEGDRPQRIGDRFTKSEEYVAFGRSGAYMSEQAFMSAAARGLERPITILHREEIEAMLGGARMYATTITGGGSTSVGPFIQNELMPGFVLYATKRPTLAAIVGPGTTDSDVVEYVSESAPTNAGAETAEDTAAPESTYAFATNTTNVREITHFVPVTLRAMADAGQIRTIIEGKLALGVIDRLDTQIASGGGTGQDLTGIYNASGIGTEALGANTRADAIHRAITKVRVAAGVLSECDNIGLHPNDWQKLRLEKDANGQYLFGPPNMDIQKTAWGIPVVVSTVFTSGTPLVGDFGGSSTLWLREGLAVTTGLDGNDFTKRRVSLLAAMRIAFAVTRAGGFTQVTGF